MADLSVTKPAAGAKLSASASVEVEWLDTGGSPELSSVSQYVFTLCMGSNSDISAVATLGTVPAAEIKNRKYSIPIDRSAGTDGMYFIQVVAVSPDYVSIHYSDRFTLSGMQGQKAAPSVQDLHGPSAETMRVGPDGAPPPINSASFSIPYVSQTGSWRFAPMQAQPPATITATKWTRQYSTSACTFFATNTMKPKWYTTVTAVSYTHLKTHPLRPRKRSKTEI